jgi:CheY-like chemotaxis protein
MRILEFIKTRFPHTKVLIVSSDASEEQQRACFEGGADGFLDKPFEVEQLLSTVRGYAPQRRLDAV